MIFPDDSSPSGIDCDFEPSDICNYTQETNDDFDWRRNVRTTSSANTGPTADHTYGTPVGEGNLYFLLSFTQECFFFF